MFVKSFKKLMRLLGLIVLIVLASIGIGIGGGMPIPAKGKKEDSIETVIGLGESPQIDGTETDLSGFKS